MSRRWRGLALLLLLATGCAGAPLHLDPAARLPAEARARHERQVVVTIADPGVTVRTSAGASPRPYAGVAGYMGSAHAQRLAAQLALDYGLERVAAWHIASLQVHCVVFEAREPHDRAYLLARLVQDPRVESAQPMQRFETNASAPAVEDPLLPLQRAVAAMQVPAAHEWARGREVTVAVIDTGIDLGHPDMAGRVGAAFNFVDEDAAQFRSDRHGTAVAGVIAAVDHNGIGILGVAPGVEILAFKACWEEAAGSVDRCNTLTLAAALDAAIRERAQVINLSLTGPADPLLQRLVGRALELGAVVVGPAPEPAAQARTFPAGTPGVLAVIDADQFPPSGASGALAAPGRGVLTLVPGGRYDFVSGVSFSTALVSGVVALVLERQSLDSRQLAALLETTAEAVPPQRGRIINACRAVATVGGAAACGKSLASASP